jgi:hypothetical protein
MNLRKFLIFAIGSLIMWNISIGQGIEGLFDQANQAYSGEDYENAIALYDSVASQGYESAELYYNLANAHYKLNHLAPSIYFYEKSLKLDPRQEDAKYNLKLANLKVIDNIEPIPDLLLVQWFRDIVRGRSSGQWSTIALVLLWLAAGAGALFILMSNPLLKRIGFFGGITLLVLSMMALGVSLRQKSRENNGREGIIFAKNVYVKDAPGGRTDLMILHEGIKVEMMEEVNGWTKIKVSDANVGTIVGFIDSGAIRRI